MGNIGGGEILVILLLALIVLGPERLPEVARQVGRFLGNVRRVSQGFQDEVRSAMEETGLDQITGKKPFPPSGLPTARPARARPAPPPAEDGTSPAEDDAGASTEPAPGAPAGDAAADGSAERVEGRPEGGA